jgi:hypothetical protein
VRRKDRRTIKLYCDWRSLCGWFALATFGFWHHGFSGVEAGHGHEIGGEKPAKANTAEKWAHIAEKGAEGESEHRRDGIECEIVMDDFESTMICWEISKGKPKHLHNKKH